MGGGGGAIRILQGDTKAEFGARIGMMILNTQNPEQHGRCKEWTRLSRRPRPTQKMSRRTQWETLAKSKNYNGIHIIQLDSKPEERGQWRLGGPRLESRQGQ